MELDVKNDSLRLEFASSGKFRRLREHAPLIYSVRMARRLRNWTYPEVTEFLRKHGFYFLKEIGGSHQAWGKSGSDGQADTVVTVNFTHSSYPVKTLERIIRQSGIEKDAWIEWTCS